MSFLMRQRNAVLSLGQAPLMWKDNAMDFDLKSGVVAAITAGAPVLTGPSIDLLGRLLG